MSKRHWLAAYGERIPAEIDPDAYPSVAAMLEDAMRRYADKPAFRCFGETLTYAAYKMPKQVRFVDALPKSAVGKILRRDLRAIA